MNSAVAGKLEAFNRRVNEEAQDVIFSVLPSKLIELQGLLDSDHLFSSTTYNTHTDVKLHPPPESYYEDREEKVANKKRKRNDDTLEVKEKTSYNELSCRFPQRVVTNSYLTEVLNVVRSECEAFVANCDKVKLWVNITMPKMEDGDNFGVQVQEEVLTELHRAHEAAYNMRDSIRGHYVSRGKLASKLCKYPNVEDYAIALKEHDLKQFYLARQDIFELRNLYAVLTDLLHKNIAKIRAPKGNNGRLMY